MNNIEHSNIFELLSVDMDLPQQDIKDILMSKGTSGFTQYIKKQNLWIHKTELILDTEIKDAGGKVLINSGIPLNKYLVSLLDRYVKDDMFVTSSFNIRCTDSVLKMYRGKSYEKIDNIMDNYVYKLDMNANLLENTPDLKDNFSNVVDEILSTPKGICTMLKLLGNFEHHKDTIINSFSSALVTLGLSAHSYNKCSESSVSLSTKAGIACLLQNISEIAGDQLCESTASDIISTLINDSTLEQAIIMHNNTTHDSAPIFSDAVNRTNYYLRVLVTVSLFVDLVYQNKTDTKNLEVHKSLYELAELGYADREITALLGKVFLPEAKYLILEHAYIIKNKCINCPTIWSTVGDMLPVKFLCNTESCEHSGSHKTFIPKDVYVKASGASSPSIVAGIYYTCNLLTNELQAYYKTIVRNKE